MTFDKDFVLKALLQHNFLPMQRKEREEMPPIFQSETFTPEVARKLAAGSLRAAGSYQGYDAVTYKLTRFNGVPRTCTIPHPAGYAQLALCIHDNWGDLDYITHDSASLVRPMEHQDGRVMIMNYENRTEETARHLNSSFGRRLMVQADIANYFPSIYSHAIPWAAVGFSNAKAQKNVTTAWFNQLDAYVRRASRNETQGVAIGPATSNIVSEAILARVDEALLKDFNFVRFLDDYTAYCSGDAEGEKFVIRLTEELAKYKLLLNIGKTVQLPLPHALTPDWLTQLALLLPTTGQASRYHAVSYLNLALELAEEIPGGSVLKYAAKSLLAQNLEFMAKVDVLRYLMTLAFWQPILLPLLDDLFDTTTLFAFGYGIQLSRVASENARLTRSDGMAWSLYYLNKHAVPVNDELADEVVGSRDCVAMLMLYLSGQASHQARVIQFATGLDWTDLYELDQYWLLLYELFRSGAIPNPYRTEDAFDIMRAEGVGFI